MVTTLCSAYHRSVVEMAREVGLGLALTKQMFNLQQWQLTRRLP
ncbi:hypothetical protein [Synechococcus sp. M16CYN]